MPARRKGEGVEVGNSFEGNLVVVLVADNHLAEADFVFYVTTHFECELY